MLFIDVIESLRKNPRKKFNRPGWYEKIYVGEHCKFYTDDIYLFCQWNSGEAKRPSLNWEDFIATDWQEILPPEPPVKMMTLTQVIELIRKNKILRFYRKAWRNGESYPVKFLFISSEDQFLICSFFLNSNLNIFSHPLSFEDVNAEDWIEFKE